MIKEIITGTVIATTYMLEGITGFGSTVLALPFLNITIGLHLAVQLLCVFSWAIPIYIIARCGDVPVYTADFAVLTQLTGFQLTRSEEHTSELQSP